MTYLLPKQQCGTAIIGISLGNSYFNQKTISKLILFCTHNFPNTVIMINDAPAIHNYLALGYDKKKARKKARLNGNLVRNLIGKILFDLKITSVKVLDWDKEIFSTLAFESSYSELLSLYFKKGSFYDAVRETTFKVLSSKFENGSVPTQSLDEAVHYLLKELAFLQSSPTILNSKYSSYIYHDSWDIYEKFIVGFFDNKIRNDLQFVLFP